MSLQGTRYPMAIDRVDQVDDRTRERRLLVELQSRVGTQSGLGDSDNHEGRLNSVEDELDAITNALQVGTNDVYLPAHTMSARKTVNAQEGHGQLTDFPSVTLGYPNLRNGILRFYCIDTANYIEFEGPDSITSNIKIYLRDIGANGKLAFEVAGFVEAENGLKVGGEQVVGPPVTGFTTPAGTSDPTAAWDADAPELQRIAPWLKALYEALVSHGLIGA